MFERRFPISSSCNTRSSRKPFMYVSCVDHPVSLSCFLTILRNASTLSETYDSSMFAPR